MPTNNTALQRAKNTPNDIFYTQLSDIEKELSHYTQHLVGKIILCNCDGKESNFIKYFVDNFKRLGIKRLIATSYNADGKGHYLSYDGTMIERELGGNGDFRSAECIEIMKQSDIIISNPPFSLFRPYIAQLFKYDKKFLIIGSLTATQYKEIFPYVKENKVWLGFNGVKTFVKPDGTTQTFGNILWYTNLDIDKRYEPIPLIERYSPEKYPKYDNFDAIEVSRVKNIPCDYFPEVITVESEEELRELTKRLDEQKRFYTVERVERQMKVRQGGLMGVPVSFLSKHCVEQFEIIGEANHLDNQYDLFVPSVGGKETFKRILIRRA